MKALRWSPGVVLLLLGWLVFVPSASAEIPATLKSSCVLRNPAPGYYFKFCDDGEPATAGRVPNIGGISAVRVPAKYEGWEGLPAKSPDAAAMAGADPEGDVALDVDVSMPTLPAPPGGYPLIAMMHGCCLGTKTAWEDLSLDPTNEKWHFNNAWFASRGYVVLNYTARGFKRLAPSSGDEPILNGSTGETQLDSRRFEINDFQHLAGQIADDPFFNVNPQRVLATGGSYGGGFAWLALTDPIWKSPAGRDMKLAAVAPRYGWTDLVYSLIPNGRQSQSSTLLPATDGSDSVNPLGVPKKSITSLLYLSGLQGSTFPQYIIDAFNCLQAPDPYETNPVCASTISDTLPSFIADRSAYYQNEFFAKIASDPSYRIPIFNAGTFTDPLFPPVENLRMYNRLRSVAGAYPIQQYFGDYQHFVQNKTKEWADLCGEDRHICRVSDYPGGDLNTAPTALQRTGVHTRLNRFIDHYAGPPGNPDVPQPAFDVTAALQVCPKNLAAPQPAELEPGDTFSASTFEALTNGTLRLDFAGTQTTVNDVEPNPHASNADPPSNFFLRQGRCPVETTRAGPGVATYESEPLSRQATMIGGPTVSIDYSATTAQGLQLNSRFYDVFPDGTALMVDRGVRRVESASGTVTYQLHGNGWRFPAGHRIRIEIAQDDDPYIKASTITSSATLTGVKIRIPTLEPQPSDFKNRAQFCKALRDFDEASFAQEFGSGANAFGKCVSRK